MTDKIFDILKSKSTHKQATYRNTKKVFDDLKTVIKSLKIDLSKKITAVDNSVIVDSKERGAFEMEMKFSGDILFFNMHTNIFHFNDAHFITKTPYIKQNPLRGYCGVIHVYNFLSDSIKYNRLNDLGFLIGRIFINSENHFFVEGQGQLGFLFKDFENQIMSPAVLKQIVETAMIFSLELDLEVPPLEKVNVITLQHKLATKGNEEIKTGKKVGFGYTNQQI